jgi:formate hydrogenlyase transcriptional activator
MDDRAADARRLRFALAAADAPVSIDALAAAGLWSPSALFGLVEAGRAEGCLALDPSGPGRIRWADGAPRGPALAAATADDLAALLARPPFPAILLAAARAAARERDLARAAPLYRAICSAPDRSLLEGGEAGWVGAVVETIRYLRATWAVGSAILDAAIASAEARGDLGAQAVLLAARGLQWMESEPDRGRGLLARATDAAEAAGSDALLREVRTYIAISLVLGGRLREGIAAFEALLGDVPADLLAPGTGPQVDLQGEAPAAALGILAFAYVATGEAPRGLDLIERLRARGAELCNPSLIAQAALLLGLARVLLGDAAGARSHAEAAHAHWRGRAGAPYVWHAALGLAAVRAAEGRAAEARQLLAEALPALRGPGRPFAGGALLAELLEALERTAPPLEGLDLASLLARDLAAPGPLDAGVAHWFSARRLLRAGGDATRPRAADHLARAAALLREAGARPALRRVLDEAIALAEAAGDREAAARSRAERDGLPGAVTPGAAGPARDPGRLLAAILDLGRLDALPPRSEGRWGELCARLCRDLGAERAAIAALGDGGPRLVAARGGSAWREALLARLRAEPPAAPAFGPALPVPGDAGGGQLALVPFDDEGQGRGVVALENRDAPPAIGPADGPALAALGRQVGILLSNAALWTELTEARQRLQSENRYHREEAPAAPLAGGRMVARSAAMRQVLALVERVAPATTPVLVTGETGVGKELVAREVHLRSPRRDRPFVAVHVAALSPGLVASALFGHERGAFTGATAQTRGRFELADGGTLFLDEVGELSPEDQVRLLRVLQEGTFERVGGTRPLASDFRLVAATHRDLEAEVRAGRFREDLYFRLAAFPLRVPPLRERPEEIATLALYFLERTARRLGVAFDGLAEADVARLRAYRWPGNVRELAHVIERAALLSDPPRLRIPPLEGGAPARATAPPTPLAREWVSLAEAERRYVREVLFHVGGRVNGPGGAADLLGLKPSTLQFRIDRLGLRDDLRRARARRGP